MAAKFDTRTMTVLIAQGTSPQQRAQTLARAAQEGVAELIRSGQATPHYTRFVDGVKGAAEDAVKPDGTIAYRFSYMGEVASFAAAFLFARSPVRSGTYRASFMVAINGRPVLVKNLKPESVPEDATLLFYSPEPYSRPVDVQLAGGKKLKFKVPPGLFDDTAKAVNKQFGNLVKAQRLYSVAIPGSRSKKRGTIQYPGVEIAPR